MPSNIPRYRFSDNAAASQANDYGNYILRRGVGEIRKPTWQRTETVLRFLPQWNFVENRWEPFRCSPAPMDLGDWIRRYDAVRGFGENGITMLLYDPITNPSYDIQSNPCVILYRAVNSAIDNRQCEPDWPALLKGGNNRRAALSRHQSIYVARCGIFRIKSIDMATSERAPLGLSKDNSAYFIELPKTAGEKLTGLLEERTEGFEGSPDDYANAFKYGDIVSLDQGAFVHIFEEGADPRANMAYQSGGAPRQLVVGSGGRGNYGGGGGSNFKGFDLYIDKEWNGYSANLNSPDMEQLIKSKQRPWEDCLNFFSHQEQAFLIQDGFPARAIMYAWRDHPEWIKDETRSKAVGKVSASFEQPASRSDAAESFRQATNPVLRTGGQMGGGTKSSEKDTNTPNQAVKIGGWGDKAWDENTAREGAGKDGVVVPDPLLDTPTENQTTKEAESREAKALAALEIAKARAAGRS